MKTPILMITTVLFLSTSFSPSAIAGVGGDGGGLSTKAFEPRSGGSLTLGSGNEGGGTFGAKVHCTSDNFEISGPAVLRKTFMKDLFEMNDGVVNCEVESNSIDLR